MSSPASWPEVLSTAIAGRELSREAIGWAMSEILAGEATTAQIAGFAVALRAKGETVAEIDALAEQMYEHAVRISVPGPAVDVVGTGGDRANTVNISTMAALTAAGAGARVVKHGNRSASSACGAADLLEELGLPLDLGPDRVAAIGEEIGITFCFAPAFHPSLRHAGPARRELGVPTPFNFLGPLANPARPDAQAVGVADTRMAGVIAGAFAARGARAWVFRGDDGLDELTTTTTSRVWMVRDGAVTEDVVDPRALDLQPAAAADLVGGDAAYNARVCRAFLAGERGPVRDAVLLNAAAALTAYDENAVAGAPHERLREGVQRAAHAIDSGATSALLERWLAAARS